MTIKKKKILFENNFDEIESMIGIDSAYFKVIMDGKEGIYSMSNLILPIEYQQIDLEDYRRNILYLQKNDKWIFQFIPTLSKPNETKYASISLIGAYRVTKNWVFNVFVVSDDNGNYFFVGENFIEYKR